MRGRLAPRRGRLASLRDRDRGSSVVELVILAPLLIFAGMLIIQYAMWFDARHAALAAAQNGALVARENANSDPGGWQSEAVSDAQAYYRDLDTSVLTNVTAKAAYSGVDSVRVTVSGKLNWLFALNISATVTSPIECFRSEVSGGQQCAGN